MLHIMMTSFYRSLRSARGQEQIRLKLKQAFEAMSDSDRLGSHSNLVELLDHHASFYAELAKYMRNNHDFGQSLRKSLIFMGCNLAKIEGFIEKSRFPKSEIAFLYLCRNMGPSSIAKKLSLDLNSVKYHIKTIKRHFPEAAVGPFSDLNEPL